jgi:hypothetical protein
VGDIDKADDGASPFKTEEGAVGLDQVEADYGREQSGSPCDREHREAGDTYSSS